MVRCDIRENACAQAFLNFRPLAPLLFSKIPPPLYIGQNKQETGRIDAITTIQSFQTEISGSAPKRPFLRGFRGIIPSSVYGELAVSQADF